MKYAILYSTETGNTKQLAEEIFVDLPSGDKVIADVNSTSEIPEADFYFIGFPVNNYACSLKILDILESLENKDIAVFASCGLLAHDKYKERIERVINPWINEGCRYHGIFLCQCRAAESFKEQLSASMPDKAKVIEQIFEKGDEHPNDADFDHINDFVQSVINQ